jgi:hypothetical protein
MRIVPEGQPIIAQRFIAGSAGTEDPSSPEGTTESLWAAHHANILSSLRDSHVGSIDRIPALKCWAIIKRPSGATLRYGQDLPVTNRPQHIASIAATSRGGGMLRPVNGYWANRNTTSTQIGQ